MWAEIEQIVDDAVHGTFDNARVTFTTDGTPVIFLAVFTADAKAIVPDDNAPPIDTTDPTIDILKSRLGRAPREREHVAVEVQNPDGSFQTAVAYRVRAKETMGADGVVLHLVRA